MKIRQLKNSSKQQNSATVVTSIRKKQKQKEVFPHKMYQQRAIVPSIDDCLLKSNFPQDPFEHGTFYILILFYFEFRAWDLKKSFFPGIS